MDSYHQHRVALFNAFTTECNRFDSTLKKEFAHRDKAARRDQDALQAELDNLRERASRADTLQQENDQLRAKLEATLPGHNELSDTEPSSKPDPVRSTSGISIGNGGSNCTEEEISRGQSSVSREKYEKLAVDFHQLYRNYQVIREAQGKLIEKWDKQKGTIDLWKAYAKKVQERAERRQKKVGFGNIGNFSGASAPGSPVQPELRQLIFPPKATSSGLDARTTIVEPTITNTPPNASPLAAIPSRVVSPVPSIRNEPTTLIARRRQERLARSQDHTPNIPIPDKTEGQGKKWTSLIARRRQERLARSEDDTRNIPDKTQGQGTDQSSTKYNEMRSEQHDQNQRLISPQLPSPLERTSFSRKEQTDAAEQLPQSIIDLPRSPIIKAQHPSSDITNDEDHQVVPYELPEPRPIGDGEMVPIKSPQLSSDPPVIISERSLKRRRGPSGPRTIGTFDEPQASIHGSAIKPIPVKSEQGSSSPIGIAGLQGWQETNESLDLDEIGDRVFTPRKRRRFQELIRSSQRELQRGLYNSPQVVVRPDQTETDRATTYEIEQASGGDVVQPGHLKPGECTTNISATTRVARPSKTGLSVDVLNDKLELDGRGDDEAICFLNSLPPEERDNVFQGALMGIGAEFARDPKLLNRALPPEHSDHKPWACRNSTDASIGVLKQTPQMLFDHSPRAPAQKDGNCASEKPRNKASAASNSPNILNSKDPNMKVLPRTSEASSKSKPRPRKGRDSAAARLRNVAEDGEENCPTTLPKSNSVSRKNIIRQRLDNLLEEPSPKKEFLPGLVRSLNFRYGGPTLAGSIDEVGRPNDSHPYNVVDKNAFESTQPDEEPFRARPLRRLGLEHFKINPQYNQGLDYAFVETVRNRDQRQCLPGCTRAECCGDKFRKLVKIGGAPTPQRPGLWDSSQVNEDQRLLEDYLGDNRGRTEVMNDKSREELLLQARTKQFADKHGRHRHAYERRTTPPGFWRTDMPTTQETEQDREDARKMERQKVEERFREAMRPGGRWLFRDE